MNADVSKTPDSQTALVMLVDADELIGDGLVRFLSRNGYQVERVPTTDQAIRVACDFQLVLLSLPTRPLVWTEFLKEVRARCTVPILVLHGQDQETDGISALEHGADDYVCRACDWESPDELAGREVLARMATSLRQMARTQEPGAGQEIVLGSLVIDLARQMVSIRGTPVHLTVREFDLLAELARAEGGLVPHDTLLEKVWGLAGEGQRHYVHVHVSRLRQRLASTGSNVQIRTRQGRGYELVLEGEE